MDARQEIYEQMANIAPCVFSDTQQAYILEAMQRYADWCINEQKQANGAEQSDSNCNIPLVSTRIDFKKLREAYFNEHVSHKTTNGIPVICTHPHNLFEWFKSELAEYGC